MVGLDKGVNFVQWLYAFTKRNIESAPILLFFYRIPYYGKYVLPLKNTTQQNKIIAIGYARQLHIYFVCNLQTKYIYKL